MVTAFIKPSSGRNVTDNFSLRMEKSETGLSYFIKSLNSSNSARPSPFRIFNDAKLFLDKGFPHQIYNHIYHQNDHEHGTLLSSTNLFDRSAAYLRKYVLTLNGFTSTLKYNRKQWPPGSFISQNGLIW